MSDFLVGIEEKYPDFLLKGRLNVESNVISCLLKDPTLLDDCKLNKDFFITSDGSFLYGMIKDLRRKKIFSIDEVSVLSNLNEKSLAKYENLGGWEQLSHAIDIVNIDNFDSYIDILYREKAILQMYIDGFALDKPIEITIKNKTKKVIPLKIFRKMTSQEVIEWYQSKLESYEVSGNSKIIEEEEIDFTNDYLESYETGEQNGISIASAGINVDDKEIKIFPWLSNQMGGLDEGHLNMIGGYSSTGKTALIVNIIMSLLWQGRKIVFIENEEHSREIKDRIIVWVLNKVFKYYSLTKKKLRSGKISEEDRKMMKQFQAWWRNNGYNKQIVFVGLEDSDIALAKKKIREYVIKRGFDTFIYDTFKLDVESMQGNRVDLHLVKSSRELDKISRKYNLLGIANVQLAEGMKGKLFLDASVLSNSKQIKETLASLLLMRNIYIEEIEINEDKNGKQRYGKFYCYPFKKEKNEKGEWVETPVELSKNEVYRILFLEKTRAGGNSEDNGIAYILKYDGDYAAFRELCFCRPKHGYIQ